MPKKKTDTEILPENELEQEPAAEKENNADTEVPDDADGGMNGTYADSDSSPMTVPGLTDDVTADADRTEDAEADTPAEEPPKRRAVRRNTRKTADTDRGVRPEGDSEESVSAPATEPAGQKPEESREGPRSFYELDFNALDRDLTPEQRQEWNSIYASYRGRSVMTGTIIGVDRHAIRVRDRQSGEMVRKEMYCAIVLPFRVRILIPETEMWPTGESRPDFVMRNLTGASIDFVIIHVDREAGFAIGSRRMALSSRRYYFSTQPALHSVGSRIKCRVLVVGPRRCLVECNGHDIEMTQRDMRYTAIPDLRDEYHPGQELDCIVKSYDRTGNRLEISVKETTPNPFDGAELRHPEGSRRQAVIAGKYAGGVFCNLPDGVVIMCSYSFHYDDAAFSIGDKVILIVQHYDFSKKQIYGKIVAKW